MAQTLYESYKINFGKRTELHSIDKPFESLTVDEKIAWHNVAEDVAFATLQLLKEKTNVQSK